MLKCKKHPKYQAKRRPRADCKMCEYIYEYKQGCERVSHEMDMEYFRRVARGETNYGPELVKIARKIVAELGLDPPCDARAYASAHRCGGSDAGGRSRG